MNIIYKSTIFPLAQTNLERVIENNYFLISLNDQSQQLKIMLENELMLLEFSKSLKATAGLLKDYETEPYMVMNIDLEIFLAEFNRRYKLNAIVEA